MADVPTWMNEQFVQQIINKIDDLKNDIFKLLTISVAPATAKGDNYASDMLRVTIYYADNKSNEKKKSIIIKLSPQKGIHKDLIKKMGHFNTEISMMSKTLKKMNDLISTSSRLSGTAFYTQTEDPVFLALEDLSPLGFQMANQHSGLDMEHTLLATRALAKFHAASVAVCEKEPDQKSLYLIGIFSSMQPPELGWFLNSIVRILADEVAKWPEAKQYAEKLSLLSTRACELGIAAAERQDDDFNVINHGDYWINNMLFRYENKKPVDLMMVDFQQSYYLSPVLDLLYFFNSSVSEEIYNDRLDDVLKEYHKTLLTTLKNLGCKTKPPTIEELQKSMKKRAFLGVIASFTTLPLVLVDKAKVTNINERISADGQIIDHPGFKDENFRRIMTARLRLFDRDGLLD